MMLAVLSGIGAVKYRHLPYIAPGFLAALSGYMLIYRTFIAKSRLSFLYSPALLLSLGWMGLKHAESQWGRGSLLLSLLQYSLILLAFAAAFLHQRMYRRFNPVTTRGLEIYTKASPLRKKGPLEKLAERFKKGGKEKIELIEFDLGEEVEFKNR